ncbi:MAG: pyridoxamine 5'-phosphate oxidase family protein [Chloroflexota bacterium]
MNEVTQQALAYLAAHHVMTLATHGPDGVWATAVFYVNDGFDLMFLSAAHTRHVQNFRAADQVAATIQEDYADWRLIQGIQCAGIVAQLDGDAKAAAINLYKQKYPFLQHAPAQIATAFAKVNWYRLRLQSLYFIDNGKGFGHRDEVILPDF